MKGKIVLVVLILLCVLVDCCGANGDESSDSFIEYLLANQFIYELTHLDAISPSEETVHKWLEAIGEKLGVALRYTTRLSRILVRRARYMTEKKFQGGRQRAAFLQGSWKLHVRVDEQNLHHQNNILQEENHSLRAQNESLQHENDTFVQQRDSLQDQLCVLQDRCDDIVHENSSLQELNDTLQEQNITLHREKESLSKQHDSVFQENCSLQCQNSALQLQQKAMECPRKPIADYSKPHQRRLKRNRKDACEASLDWLKEQGLIPTQIVVRDINTGTKESIEINVDDAAELFGEGYEEADKNDFDQINMMLMIKDSYNVSGNAYHEFARVAKEMPRHHKLKRRISELNSLWNISTTPDGSGVQQSLETRLHNRLTHLIKSTPEDADFKKTKKVRVKLSGDGTNMGKHLHVVNFTFTILDEGRKAYSAEGNYSLAIFREQESYEGIKNALADIRQEVQTLSSIRVNGQDFNIVYYLGGDWKFLALVTGVDSATSEYACIWCKCPSAERYDTSKSWSLTDTKFGARTIDENQTLSQQPKSKKRFNVSRAPLFPSIPLTNVVIDNLHLFLRVSDVLLRLLIEELKRQDSIAAAKKFSGEFDITKYKHCKGFEDFVRSIGISDYRFYIGKSARLLKVRSLTGPEKLKLLSNISIQSLLPSLPPSESSRIQTLWTDLLQINTVLSKPEDALTPTDIDEFAVQARGWVQKFTDVFHANNVTPYIHAMANHVSEFMKLHGSIISFTQHGLEKYNDCMTKQYFRATNHKGQDALRQIMEKQNRLCYFGDHVKRQKCFETTCSNCHKTGHKKVTCSEPCSSCSSPCYKDHLVKVNGKSVPTCQQENTQ